MKGKELIKFIRENELEDFEIEFCFTEKFNKGDKWLNIRTFSVQIGDVGHSEKVLQLDGEEM